MRRIFSKAFCVLSIAVVLFGSAAAAFAQSATNGAIGGTIYDQHGAILAGAEVTASNNATAESRTVTTGSSGEYKITDLPPGTYTVTVVVASFQTYKAEQVPVAVGSLSDISPKLTVGNVAETVEVTDETPIMHTQSAEISSVVDQTMIDNLPINGHRYSNFALLTPGVVVGDPDGLGLLSFRGVNYLLNNSTVDGMDDNQAYFSEQRGRTTVSYSFALAAVQEFQVNTSNYSAEYGRAAGGVTNTVTKSGGNTVHGELYFFDRDNEFGSTNPYTNVTTEQPIGSGNYVTNVVKPKDWRKSWGFGIGGPIIKDKLFFFYAYDQQQKNYPGISRFTQNAINNGVFAKALPVLTPTETCDTTSGNYSYVDSAGKTHNLTFASGQPQNQGPDSGDFAACETAYALGRKNGSAVPALSYAAGVAYYLQGLGIIQSFTGQVPRRSDQVNNFPRVDWQINDKNRLTMEYSRFRGSGFSNYQTASSVNIGNHSFGDSYVKTDFGIMRLSTVVSQSIVNELRFQYGRDFEYQIASPPGPNEANFASVPPGDPSAAAAMPLTRIGYYYDSSNYFRAGKNSSFDFKQNPNESRIQGEDILTWSHGKHTTKAGVDINRVFDSTYALLDESGDYRFPYSWNFIADYIHAGTGLGGPNYSVNFTSFIQGFGNPSENIATTDFAGFLTDDWRILPHLTLTFGLRYEYERIPPNPAPMGIGDMIGGLGDARNTQILGFTNVTPDDRNNFQPRVGFSWDVYGNGKTYLRGGYGLYYGRIINSAITSAYNQQLGAGSQQHLNGSSCGSAYSWPHLYPAGSNLLNSTTSFDSACGGFGPTINYFAKNFQLPQVEEIDLALEQNLGWNTVFSVMYMSSLGRELEGAFDQNNECAGDFYPGTPCSFSLTDTTAQETSKQYVVVNSDGVTPAPNNYVTYPHGGKPSPLSTKGYQTGSILTVSPFYTAAAKFDSNYDGLAKICACLNSNYNALAVQVNKRMSNGLQFNLNYTWAHSLDYNPYIGNDIPFGGPYDPTNVREEYGNGQLDVRQRFVGSAVFRPETHFHGWHNSMHYVADGWQISPLVQLQTGLPYTPVTTGANPSNPLGGSSYGQGSNGSGGVSASAGGLSRLIVLGRNQSSLPKSAVLDVRIQKRIYFPEYHGTRPDLDLGISIYNALNHQNITRVSQTAYCLNTGSTTASNQNCPGNVTVPTFEPGTTTHVPTNGTTLPALNYLVAQPNYGTYVNANSTLFQLTTRQIEISARLYF